MADRAQIRALLHPHTGDVSEIRPTERGYLSDLTAVVECEKGPFFVKAMRNRPGGRRDSILREKLIGPHVQSVSPQLRWDAEDESWIVLGFEAVEGRPAEFTPGSPDLPAVAELVSRMGRLDLPGVARDWPETRWDAFAADEAEARLFRGDALLHTDINPDNILIGNGATWIVDWAWPTRGAAFIDPACLVIQLIAAGHTPESAESLAAGCPGWREANPRAIDAFATANLRMFRQWAQRKPDETWLTAMATATLDWTVHRGMT